jgi:hypothetical protein
MLLDNPTSLDLTNSLRYLIPSDHPQDFFSLELIEIVTDLNSALQFNKNIIIFPDAISKDNGLPNGIAIIADKSASMLLPMILRDPGCGFLQFKITLSSQQQPDWHDIGGRLDTLINHTSNVEKQKLLNLNLNPTSLNNILLHGLTALDMQEKELPLFMDTAFTVDNQLKLTATEMDIIQNDIFTLTNTIELKKFSTHAKTSNEVFGFIHTGTQVFPNLISKRYAQRIFQASQQHFAQEAINKGIFGVKANSSLGYEYHQLLNMAMNFALVNRYYLFLLVKNFLTQHLKCEVSIINDSIHAGIFSDKIVGAITITRGVQHFNQHAPDQLRLIAGQRETISALVTKSDNTNTYFDMVAHGTNNNIDKNSDYTQHLDNITIENYLKLSKEAFYNSTPNFADCMPHTYNLMNSLSYFEAIGLAKTVCYLNPLINIQATSLIKSLGDAI